MVVGERVRVVGVVVYDERVVGVVVYDERVVVYQESVVSSRRVVQAYIREQQILDSVLGCSS